MSNNQYALTEHVKVSHTVLVSRALLDGIDEGAAERAEAATAMAAGQISKDIDLDDVSAWSQADGFGTSLLILSLLV